VSNQLCPKIHARVKIPQVCCSLRQVAGLHCYGIPSCLPLPSCGWLSQHSHVHRPLPDWDVCSVSNQASPGSDDQPRLMRRPPIACRRAVQSLQPSSPQHIWISDNLLADALSRFFPTSCPQQKRHGSHVPGPLEARRRAAKRRMTVSASFYPQENFAPLFSLGALFGFRKAPQPSWRYEAPSLQHHVEPLDSRTFVHSDSPQFLS
jgi:hypothetical protein